ncbi:hypothetical protein QAD02_001765 [Eretmocerus hayati]|uniref:Uncharacterized protein n=1 Tax=Eretmocerus hayati TaxID=131215 RepID=A0ACC2NHD9_9HYME|nr:hypothetical protein QAD02_001765 [Eretmocerus hayati]
MGTSQPLLMSGTTMQNSESGHQMQHLPLEDDDKEQDEPEDNNEVEEVLSRCRLCAASASSSSYSDPTSSTGLRSIFDESYDEEGGCELANHIFSYLHITVSLDDRLPKKICEPCIEKLDSIHEFATLALKSQELLEQEILGTSSTVSAVTVESLDGSDDVQLNKAENRGLLHSILTKGPIETSANGEMIQDSERAPSAEEMEVKIDPMLFLQYAVEQSYLADNSECSDDSEREAESLSSSASRPPHIMNESHVKQEIDSEAYDNNHGNECNEMDHNYHAKFEMSDEGGNFEEDKDLASGKRKSLVCKICTKTFSSQIALQDHLWSHLPAKFSDKSAISRVEEVLNSAKVVIVQNDSENSKHFICPICGKKISTKGNLKVHLETHRPKGKYGCDICGRIFKTPLNLFRHKEYHSGVQYPCSVCGRVYPTNSTLRAHSITHSDLRPHACPLCDKTFKRNQDLKFHINQHTGARPYQCPYCPKAFASSGNCFSHRKRMHPREVHRDRQRAADLMR